MENLKTCSKCKANLPKRCFYRDAKGTGGLRSDCKQCNNSKRHSYRNCAVISKKWREENKAYIKKWKSAYRKSHLEEEKIRSVEWKNSHLEQYNLTQLAKRKNRVDRLVDSYVIETIRQSVPSLRTKDIPMQFIEAKRQHLKVQRLIKEKQK